MCFQRSSERIEGKSRLPQSGWKIVPQWRTGCRETPIAKFVVCSWHKQLPDVVGMRPQRTTTSVRQNVCLCVCVCVCESACWAHAWAVQKRLNWSRCRLWMTHVGPRNHVLDGVKIGRIHSPPREVTRRRCGFLPNYFEHLLLSLRFSLHWSCPIQIPAAVPHQFVLNVCLFLPQDFSFALFL